MWIVLVAISIALNVQTFIIAFQISKYDYYWLDILDKNQGAYSCTLDSLYLNLPFL